MNVLNIEECQNWQKYWSNNLTKEFDIIVNILYFK